MALICLVGEGPGIVQEPQVVASGRRVRHIQHNHCLHFVGVNRGKAEYDHGGCVVADNDEPRSSQSLRGVCWIVHNRFSVMRLAWHARASHAAYLDADHLTGRRSLGNSLVAPPPGLWPTGQQRNRGSPSPGEVVQAASIDIGSMYGATKDTPDNYSPWYFIGTFLHIPIDRCRSRQRIHCNG
jgi:hypothetical protein